ncbi:hypothetical protein [Halosolutus halophilus]|nr:hypothetical protein [Halosolutus halophilus]
MKDLITSMLFRGPDATVVRECRQCGTGVSPSVTTCPVCEADRIVEYVIE